MKKILPILTLFLVFHLATIAFPKIYGVITYYFNQYQGDKPDIGAHITVIDSAKFDMKFLMIAL